jgi:hypothetical protein
MKVLLKVSVLCALLLAPAAVWAAHPLQVEDTGTEGKGNYLFEIAGDYAKDGSVKSTKLTSNLTAGVGAHTDLALEIPYLILNPSTKTEKTEKGIGDVRLKVKHRIFENEVKQSMAYQAYVDLPEGNRSKGLGSGGANWGFMLMDSQECHDTTLHLSVGYEVLGSDLKALHLYSSYALFTGFAVEHKLSASYRFLTEIRAESQKEKSSETGKYEYSRPVTLMAGMVYDISKFWYVDLGVRAGLNKYAEDVAVLAGTAWRF